MIKNIAIELIANKLVFEGDFPQSNEIIKEWDFQSNSIDKDSLEGLYTEAILKRGGWSSCDIESTTTAIRFSLKPTFFVDSLNQELNVEENEFINSIIKQVDQYVQKHRLEPPVSLIKINQIGKESEVVVYREEGQSNSKEFQRFIEQLKNNGISYHIEYEYSNAVDIGASGGVYEVILFIQNTIASGVLYDLIKSVPARYFPNLKKERIDILKEKLAHYLYTQPENIDITWLETNDSYVCIDVSFNRVKYQFEFDNRNEIINIKKDN
jgi:hypothetical protein